MAQVDPYHQIKEDIERELWQFERRQQDTTSSVYPASVKYVDEQLSALEAAVSSMVAQPVRFGLTSRLAYQRQVEVENLRFQFADICTCQDQGEEKRPTKPQVSVTTPGVLEVAAAPFSPGEGVLIPSTMKEESSARPSQSLTSQFTADPHQSSLKANEAFVNNQTGLMQQRLEEQDHVLEDISVHLGNVRHIGVQLNEELEEQALLMEDLEAEVDTTHTRLRMNTRRIQEMLRRSGMGKQLALIVGLSVVLLVLTVIAFV